MSDDDGISWRQMPGTSPSDPGKSDFLHIERIAVDVANGDVVVAASSGDQNGSGGGVWRTLNATSANPTWEKIYDQRAMDLEFDPYSPNRLLVGELNHFNGGAVGVIADVTTATTVPPYSYTRTRLDSTVIDRVEIAFARATPGLVVASIGTFPSGIYVSTDSGATWNFNMQNSAQAGDYSNTLWIDPTDSTRLLVGGVNLYRLDGSPNWWTTNAPLTATFVGAGHADNHIVVEMSGYDAAANRSVYIGNDGGLYRRDDIPGPVSEPGGALQNLNNGLEITQFYSGAGRIYPGGTTRIVGGTQDNGSLVAPPGGTSWSSFLGGDGGMTAVDPVDPEVFYTEIQSGGLFRRSPSNSGFICGGAHGIADASSACGGTQSTNFVSPFLLDPNDPAAGTMLFGGQSLWRSVNVKTGLPPDWTNIKPGTFPNFISAVAMANGNSDVVWVGHNFGDVFCTTNGTAASPTWTQVATQNFRMVTRIMIDPANPNRVFVTYGGYNAGNVVEFSDATQVCKVSPTRTDRHANLPQAPVYSITRHALNPNLLYVGTQVGVFGSTDGGQSWSPTNDGAGTVAAQELFWLDGTTLVAATYGRGMFQTNVSPGAVQFAQVAVSVPETAGFVALTVTRGGGTAGAVSVSYATSDGSGHAGVNYSATQGTLSWADGGAADKIVTVPIVDDHAAAGDKTFAVTLSNAMGGAVLGGAGAVTVTITDTAASAVPGVPTIGTASAGAASITVTFSPPSNAGGSPITSYTATCSSAGGNTASATASQSPIAVAGVTMGATYTCVVAATNSAGAGPASAPSNPVVPAGPGSLSLSSASLDFGGQSMGTTSAPASIIVTNAGGSTVTVSSIAVSAQFDQANDCGALAPTATCTVTVTFSPAIAAGALNSEMPVSGTLTVSSDAPSSPATASLAGTAEKSLVAHYYRSILRRAPDQAGHDFWQGESARVAALGANVNETWYALAMSFFNSQEYANFNTDDAGFLGDLYLTFFNRAPDSDGLDFWMSQLQRGMPRDGVLANFMFSPEFRNFTQAIFGATSVRAEIDMTMDMYRGTLARLPDSAGFNFYLGEFRKAQCQGNQAVRVEADQVSNGFLMGQEYANRQRTNAQYMADLYNAYMRRGPDLAGIQFYIGQLDGGQQTREQVREQFVASPEFTNRVTDVANAGCVQ